MKRIMMAIGILFSMCTFGEQHFNIAETKKAAEQGNAKAQYTLALCYAEGVGVAQDPVEAVKWYRKAAKQGHEMAIEMLGKIQFQKDEAF